jgi:hypothetical protein
MVGAGVVRAPADRPLRPRVDVVARRLGSPPTVHHPSRASSRRAGTSRPCTSWACNQVGASNAARGPAAPLSRSGMSSKPAGVRSTRPTARITAFSPSPQPAARRRRLGWWGLRVGAAATSPARTMDKVPTRGTAQGCANSMTTLMSSGARCSACWTASGRTRRVTSCSSHDGSRVGERRRRAVVVAPVGVDRAEHRDVLEHHFVGQRGRRNGPGPGGRAGCR